MPDQYESTTHHIPIQNWKKVCTHTDMIYNYTCVY